MSHQPFTWLAERKRKAGSCNSWQVRVHGVLVLCEMTYHCGNSAVTECPTVSVVRDISYISPQALTFVSAMDKTIKDKGGWVGVLSSSIWNGGKSPRTDMGTWHDTLSFLQAPWEGCNPENLQKSPCSAGGEVQTKTCRVTLSAMSGTAWGVLWWVWLIYSTLKPWAVDLASEVRACLCVSVCVFLQTCECVCVSHFMVTFKYTRTFILQKYTKQVYRNTHFILKNSSHITVGNHSLLLFNRCFHSVGQYMGGLNFNDGA